MANTIAEIFEYHRAARNAIYAGRRELDALKEIDLTKMDEFEQELSNALANVSLEEKVEWNKGQLATIKKQFEDSVALGRDIDADPVTRPTSSGIPGIIYQVSEMFKRGDSDLQFVKVYYMVLHKRHSLVTHKEDFKLGLEILVSNLLYDPKADSLEDMLEAYGLNG